jgi:hypothetical protein
MRLFDLFRGPHLSALAFGTRSSLVAAELAKRFPRHVRAVSVPASEAQPRADYDVRGDTLLLVRPDGYIGMRSTEPTQSHAVEYLRRMVPFEYYVRSD